MNPLIRKHLDNVHSTDKDAQNAAFEFLIAATAVPVDWAYEAWDGLVEGLRDGDNRCRAVASQVLANLAKSDPEKRMLRDVRALLAVTRDDRFVTARHCLQSLWKVGVAGDQQRKVLVDGLAARFKECAAEKNCTLIRHDIMQSLRKIYETVEDDRVRKRALALMETEPDLKYRKKYATVWKMK